MMDINKPVTNPSLLKAIQRIRKDRTKESQFYEELFKATFLCPGQIDKSSSSKSRYGKTILGEGSKLSLSFLKTKSGDSYLMAFTDWRELRNWQDKREQQTFLFPIEDYKRIILANQYYDGIVINPFGANVVLDRFKLENISLNHSTIKKAASVMIGKPRNYPRGMIDRLTSYFQTTKLVDEAYLLWMARGHETSYLLVLNSTLIPQERKRKATDDVAVKIYKLHEQGFSFGKIAKIISGNLRKPQKSRQMLPYFGYFLENGEKT